MPPLWFCIISKAAPLDRFYSPGIANLQGEKHVFFMHKTQPVPAGYAVNKSGLGGAVWVPDKIETPIMKQDRIFRTVSASIGNPSG